MFCRSLFVFSGVRVARAFVLCVCFVDRFFVLVHLAIVLSVLLQFTDSVYPFGIFKLKESADLVLIIEFTSQFWLTGSVIQNIKHKI
jgi:hypothetical protein